VTDSPVNPLLSALRIFLSQHKQTASCQNPPAQHLHHDQYITMKTVLAASVATAAMGQNIVGTVLPTELDGTWVGGGSNFFNFLRPNVYDLKYTVSECTELYQECGEVQYSLMDEPGVNAGKLVFYGETGCQDHLSGRRGTGRCYSFLEDFRAPADVGFPENGAVFSLTHVVLNEQRDGSMFWTYMQGGIATGTGYLAKSTDMAALPPPSSEKMEHERRELQRLFFPLGSIISPVPGSNDFPRRHDGVWVGNDISETDGIPGFKFGSQVRLDIREGGCNWLNDFLSPGTEFLGESCGVISFPESGAEEDLEYIMKTQCFDYVKGPEPMRLGGECYMMESIRFDLLDSPGQWDEDSLRFMTFSMQRDGGLYWTYMMGTVVKSSGMLYRE
jgi:hypothetical protein